ncbi:MAG: hypothetical protein HYX34_04015 [Actinobacteria bacterium]|nr:hypothetical protein [Actinomycetota bacterium]
MKAGSPGSSGRPSLAAAAVLAAVLVLAVGACGSNDPEPRSDPTTTTSPSTTTSESSSTTTTTTAPADPWAIPDEIDVAYVQRIVTKLQDIGLAAYDDVRKDPSTAADATRRLATVFSLRYFPTISNELAGLMRSNFANFRPNSYRVIRIDRADRSCTVATVQGVANQYAISLVPISRATRIDPEVNPTPWVINYIYRANLATPEKVCAGS